MLVYLLPVLLHYPTPSVKLIIVLLAAARNLPVLRQGSSLIIVTSNSSMVQLLITRVGKPRRSCHIAGSRLRRKPIYQGSTCCEMLSRSSHFTQRSILTHHFPHQATKLPKVLYILTHPFAPERPAIS